MHAGRIRDIAHHFARVSVNHHDVSRARDVKAARICVDGQIIPATFPTQFVSVHDVVSGTICCERCCRHGYEDCREPKPAKFVLRTHDFFSLEFHYGNRGNFNPMPISDSGWPRFASKSSGYNRK